MQRSLVESVCEMIRLFNMQEYNALTLALMKHGIAASFNQYIPEIHDEVAAPEENAGLTPEQIDPPYHG